MRSSGGQQPLISIGITCFEAAATIGRALKSALAQDWPSLEIIVVDDCSKDGTAEIVAGELSGVANARLIRHDTNRGVAAARQSILHAARGEFIAFFDDDDESTANRLSLQHRTITSYEAAAGVVPIACYASGARQYPNGYRLDIAAIGSKKRGPVGSEIVDYLLFNERKPSVFYGGGTPTCALMVRTQLLRDGGGFDVLLRRVEDVDLAIRLGFLGTHFIGCPERLYLQYATSGADKTPQRDLEALLAITDKYREYLERRHLYSYARLWFRFRCEWFMKNYLTAAWFFGILAMRYPVRALRHLWVSAPARLSHERAMNAESPPPAGASKLGEVQ